MHEFVVMLGMDDRRWPCENRNVETVSGETRYGVVSFLNFVGSERGFRGGKVGDWVVGGRGDALRCRAIHGG
jgi:hypothetical protein